MARDYFYTSPSTHEFLLKRYAHKQVLKSLSIKPLPKELTSFIGPIMQLLPVQTHRLQKQKINGLMICVAKMYYLSLSDLNDQFAFTQTVREASIQ